MASPGFSFILNIMLARQARVTILELAINPVTLSEPFDVIQVY